MRITKGVKTRPVKVLIYGTEGIGKSTFASKFPEPVFIDLEGGTHYLDISRVDGVLDWPELLDTVAEISASNYKTLVIDTADWAERLAIQYICKEHKKSGIEEFGYGAGYTYLVEEFGKLIKNLDRVIAHGINVVILAHATLRTITLPEEQGSYDHWELKLNTKTTNKVAPLVKEWADMVLFMNYKTMLVEDKTANMGAKKKAVGGKRVMYTTHTTFCDAKNRFGLENELPLEYEQIAAYIPNGADELPSTLDDIPEELPRKERLFIKLEELCRKDAVTEHQIQEAVSQKGYYDVKVPIAEYDMDFIEGVLIGAWEQIKEFIKTHPFDTDVPF